MRIIADISEDANGRCLMLDGYLPSWPLATGSFVDTFSVKPLFLQPDLVLHRSAISHSTCS
jgi:hypothetical protein